MSKTSPGALEQFDPHVFSGHHAAALSQHVWDNMPATSGKTAATPAETLQYNTAEIYRPSQRIESSAPVEAPPMTAPQIESALKNAKSINFTSPAQDAQSGRQPDYILGADGQLRANPKATPSKDGSVTIEVASKNKQEIDAKKLADQLQKASIKDLINYFKNSHPKGTPIPQDWLDQLNKEPDLPPPVVPLDPAPAPDAPPPPADIRPPQFHPPGGGFAGTPGFDNSGYYHPSSAPGGDAPGVWTGGSDSHGQPIGPGETAPAKEIYDYFINKGLTPAQASGILGNLQTESSFRTNAYNSGEGAIGLAQWEGGRRTELEAFAKQEGKPVTNLGVQLDFIWHELNTSERHAFADLKAAQTPAQAAKVFQSEYERSASLGPRAANAQQWYSRLS